MKKDFDTMIKNLEQELTDLKTSARYASVRSARTTTQTNVTTGLYRVTYENTNVPVFSFVYGSPVNDNWGTVWARTPSGNTQVVEVNTDEVTYPNTTHTAQMIVISNKPVVSITRIS